MCLFKVKKVMFFIFILAFFISQPTLAKTTVWTYTDYKSRESDEKAFQKDWPESMMTGIFSAAFKKMPFVGK